MRSHNGESIQIVWSHPTTGLNEKQHTPRACSRCRCWADVGDMAQEFEEESIEAQFIDDVCLNVRVRHLSAHMHIHTYIHTYMLTYLHTYILTYLHTYILTYLHTYILTYIHPEPPLYIAPCVKMDNWGKSNHITAHNQNLRRRSCADTRPAPGWSTLCVANMHSCSQFSERSRALSRWTPRCALGHHFSRGYIGHIPTSYAEPRVRSNSNHQHAQNRHATKLTPSQPGKVRLGLGSRLG